MNQETVQSKVEADSESLSFIRSEAGSLGKLQEEFSGEQLKFIKNLINKDLEDGELLMFIAFANKLRLSPFTGEIVAVVYKGDYGRTVTPIVTRNGKRVIATRTNELESLQVQAIYRKKVDVTSPIPDGSDEKPTVQSKYVLVEPWEDGELWGAKAVAIRNGKEFLSVVSFKEYNTNKSIWLKKPETMIKKVAESQALSAAFPEILGGVYDESERDSFVDVPKLPQTKEDKPAEPSQIETLKSLGVEIPEDLTYNGAIELLDSKLKGKK